jgi:putative transposase
METDGLQEGKTRWCHYQIGYHLIWLPKYRRKIFVGGVESETKKLIAECCEQHDLTLLALETDMDHVHVFVSAPPRLSPSTIAGLLKGHTSRYLREKFPHLKKLCGKEHLWSSSYYVGTAGSVSAEVIRHYIMECQGK